MDVSIIEEVRLQAFKSFFDATLPLDDLTLLIGRNGTGKSNALDALTVLSRSPPVTISAMRSMAVAKARPFEAA